MSVLVISKVSDRAKSVRAERPDERGLNCLSLAKDRWTANRRQCGFKWTSGRMWKEVEFFVRLPGLGFPDYLMHCENMPGCDRRLPLKLILAQFWLLSKLLSTDEFCHIARAT